MTSLMLHDLMNPVQLADEMERGYVREQQHPDDPSLRILNYTHKAQYDRAWNDVTTQCRGLIHRDGLVLARPFSKFFNYGEHDEMELNFLEPVEVTDKMDGSLGILYPTGGRRFHEGRFAIATRGSFDSDQARHATGVWLEKYEKHFTPIKGMTLLFEIIYPENRIVVDYGDLDDLFLLGAVTIETGRFLGPRGVYWPGPRAITKSHINLRQATKADHAPGSEGVVVRFLESGMMLKLKSEEYVRLHRIVTGLTPRRVHELMSADPMDDGPLHELCSHIPDEFATWVWQVAADLRVKLIARHLDAVASFQNVLAKVGRQDRRAFAQEAVKDKKNQALMFMLLDGRDPTRTIWRDLRPSGENALVQQSEDVA